ELARGDEPLAAVDVVPGESRGRVFGGCGVGVDHELGHFARLFGPLGDGVLCGVHSSSLCSQSVARWYERGGYCGNCQGMFNSHPWGSRPRVRVRVGERQPRPSMSYFASASASREWVIELRARSRAVTGSVSFSASMS